MRRRGVTDPDADGRAVAIAVRVGAGLGAVGMGTGVAAAVVTQVADSWAYSGYDPVPLNIAVAVFFSAMGVLVTWHKPGNVIGWTMLAIAAWCGVGVLLTALAGAFDSPADPAVGVVVGIQIWFWAPPIWAITTILPMVYPDGRLPSRRWWWAIALTTVGLVVYEVGLALAEEDFVGRYTVANPLAVPQWQDFAQFCLRAGEYLLLAATIVAVAGLVSRWLRATGVRRRRISLLLLAFAFGAVQAVVRDRLPGQLPLVLDRGLEVLAFVLVSLAIAVAVTRERLFDLNLAVRRAVVGVVSAGAVFACYLAGFAVLGSSSVLTAGVVGSLLFPVATLLVRRVRRLAWGGRVDVVEAAVRLGNRIRNQLDSAEVPGAVCEQIVRSLRLRMARLELDTEAGFRRLAQVGAPDRSERATQATFELWYRGVRVGRLHVLPPDGRSYLDEMRAQALASLADQVAPVVAALRLDEELLRSREQLVTAREEERSRLSRELHDNVGPTLAGTRLQIESVRAAVPAESIALLDRATRGIDEALRTLRRVVHGLRPPELDTLGLAGALRELAVFLSGPSLRVETALPPSLDGLSKEVEVAAYRIVAEALTNVVRHAEATRAEITVRRDGARLIVLIRDDGVGVPPDAGRNGMGLRFMAQRAEEMAGEFTYRSDDAGTAVRAVLPVPTAGQA